MLRLTDVLLLVALGTVVVAGPTVRRDEVATVATTPVEAESVKPIPAADVPPSTAEVESKPAPAAEEVIAVELAVAADEQPSTTDATTPAATADISSTGDTKPSSEVATATTSVAPSGESTATTGGPAAKPPRKTITFDQRQEGKYNIRADLENFVIVVVPSGSTSGASLLDLLTRSAHKKDAHHHHHHHHQTRKHSQRRKNNKGAPKKVPQVTPEVIVLDESNQRSGQLVAEEFIEGRTPYKVDLSSSARSVDGGDVDTETAREEKPTFRFSVEPASPASGRVRFPVASGNYPRASSDVDRALRAPAGFANTNTLVVAASSATNTYNNLPGDGAQPLQPLEDPSLLLLLRPLRRGDDERDSAEDDGLNDHADADNGDEGGNGPADQPAAVYPATAQTADHSHDPSSFDSLEYAPLRSDVDMTQLQLQPDGDQYDDLADQRLRQDQDGWDELRLLGAQEQCGPDRKRDSYGVCQFVRP